MRVAFIGASHWHAPLYYRPAARLPGVRIVAVSDPDLAIATRAGRELEATAFSDHRTLIEEAHPDFVFAFGRHCDMPQIASTLIDGGIPFLLEKPGGFTSREVRAIRDRTRAKGLYAGTGFNFRVSDLYRKIRAVTAEEGLSHASFRYIAGGPYRYRESNCAWMLDPKLSGGGSTINLSIHFMDMFRTFAGSAPQEIAALMANSTWNLPIEDYSSVILRAPGSACTIETGYTYPGALGFFDVRFSIRTSRHYLVVRSDDCVEVHRTCDSHVETISTPVSNAAWYPVFVTETIDRFARGQPPVADLDALVDAMELVDAAYASSKAGGERVNLTESRRETPREE
jgi:predicted dehydrogenase